MSLYESSAKSFSVPPGFVLTVDFFQSWLEQIQETKAWNDYVIHSSLAVVTKEDCDAIKGACKEILSMSDEQMALLQQAIATAFGDNNLGIVAVRSSSPEEDLAGMSFAGGYETTLGVTWETLQDAIIDSFASMFDHRIHLYKIQHAIPTDAPKIAIIIQRQIASTVSGVGFSINPSNNCYDEIMISANFGLGESVVGGIITPDTYVVDRFQSLHKVIVSKKVAEKTSAIWLDTTGAGGTRQDDNQDPTAQALTDEQILKVADLVARVEEHGGDCAPVDTEWAFDKNGKLYLLQARPVTAYIPLFPEMITKRGQEKRLYLDIMIMSQGFSDPLSVLGLDLWKTILKRIKPTMSTDGFDGLVWNLHGREYMSISNMMKMTGGKAMINTVLRSYDKALDRAFDSIDLKDYEPSYMPEGAKGVMRKQLAQLWKIMPNLLRGLYQGDSAMTEYIDGTNAMIERNHADNCSKDELFREAYEELMGQYEEVMPPVAGGLIAGVISRGWLHRMFSTCEGAKDHLISMCMDLKGNPTSMMGHAMVRLASFPEFQETDSSETFLQKLKEETFSPKFMAEYNDYIKKFGCRGIREIDAATPRTHEDQGGLFNTLNQIDVKDNRIINVRERRDKAYRELLKMAKHIGKEKQFVHHAGIIQSLLGYREHPKYMLVVMIDRMRRHALNIAKEFVAQGRLDKEEQIFALTIDQVTEAQTNSQMKLLPLVDASLAPYQKVSHVKNWPLLIDSRGKIIRGTRQDGAASEDGTLIGDPISPGMAKGRAKVLMSPYEKLLESGEILVARFTEPSWTPLFINAAGVVMEVGGPMQHGAIIAREYGIPCVSGMVNATKLISDGDLLEVDGSSGTVRILVDKNDAVGARVENGPKD